MNLNRNYIVIHAELLLLMCENFPLRLCERDFGKLIINSSHFQALFWIF